ncbi:branched-chain amino acid ABC transporter permease [Allocoleopsis franciscana]|uniref:Amino acid/amide ABC transporter membrane protein 2, HAAT family n=1 Tax=Allocoleopsis franciscana PCC 7113 TaxID=1173027 RepID=K9W6Z6_9CYAN|nr:amino acid ABC transporter [Allocoleopsis franciscana]AFZ16135.1 amino acid/amide ABC transporter membrane protein 2, HAAT family [Allocoleopsis franciscana PCC 7113]
MTQQIIKAIKSSGILGTIAALTVLLFGGWSGAVIGWLLGSAAGFMRCQGRRIITPQEGAKLGAIAGLVLGIWLLIASLLQALFAPVLGQPIVSLSDSLQYGILALVVAALAGGVMGALQGLPIGRRRTATLVTLAFILILFPFVDQLAQTNWIAIIIQIQIFIMLALGLNITVGYAGLLDLGYAAFFAIGAYTTGLLSSPQLNIAWNFWFVLPIAALVAAIFGVILGSPTLRLRGDYLAIVTLGFGEIVPVIFRNLTDVRIEEPISKIVGSLAGRPEWAICLVGCDRPLNLTGGEAGINPIGRPTLPFIGTFDASDYLPWYYLILLLVVFSYFMISRLKDSRLGRAWTAIREDELAASAMGINLVKTKLLAFAMGATFSGFAGAFYAANISAIFPSVFDFSVSVIILCMVILGGLGNMTGVILGGIIIMSADRLYLPRLAQVLNSFLNTSVLPNIGSPPLRDFIATSIDPLQMRLFLFGLTLVIMMIVRPEGLVPDALHRAELHSQDDAMKESLAEARSQ